MAEDNPEDVEWDYEREMEEYNRQLNRQVTDENTRQAQINMKKLLNIKPKKCHVKVS